VADEQEQRLFPLPVLHGFCCDVLTHVGVPATDATLVADSLTQADAAGQTGHGLVRLLPVYVRRLRQGTTKAVPQMRLIQQRGATAVVDGGSGLGQVVGHWAMDIAVKLARDNGVGLVAVRNSSHFGTASFFLKQALREHMIGVALTNAPSNMPPAGGKRPYFGTNPLCIGFPTSAEPPVILDMSTSVVARGKIVLMHLAGQKTIPEGWAIDEEGRPTTDPAAALRGAVLPVGGYKGAGLAMAVDILCGILTGAAFGPHIVNLYDEGDRVQNLGHLFAAVSVSFFGPAEEFETRLDQMVREVRSQPRQPGVDRIYVPGEVEHERAEKSAREGVPMSEAGVREMEQLAQRVGVAGLVSRLEQYMRGGAS